MRIKVKIHRDGFVGSRKAEIGNGLPPREHVYRRALSREMDCPRIGLEPEVQFGVVMSASGISFS
jgi:hypothetical protein